MVKAIYLYNMTFHPPSKNSIEGLEIEEVPRLKSVGDMSSWNSIKDVVSSAMEQIPIGSNLLVGGSVRFQAIIQQYAEHNKMQLWFFIFGEELQVIGISIMPWLSEADTLLLPMKYGDVDKRNKR